METTENKETKGLDKKKIAIIAGAAAIVVAAVVLVIVNMVKPKDSVKSTTMRLLRAIGEVSLIDNGETKTIMEDMRLADGNVITTGDKSLASIGLDDYKIVNLEENSSAEFRQDGKKLELDLLDGRLFFDVRKALDETESLDIKASNMIVGIRGTSGYVVKDKDDPNAQHLYITDGHVKVTIKDPQTGATKEVDVQYGQRLTIKKDENGNVTDVQVEDVPPAEWPAELAAEVASYEETFDRIVEATGFDKEVIMEVASGDSTVSYILELQEVIDPTPEPSPEATADPTPDPTDPPEPTVKLVEADGDGTVPPPADGNGNGNGHGQLGDGDGTTNEVTPTPSPVAPVEENPPTEDNSGDSGSGGSSDGSTPTPTAEPTTETVSPSAGAPSPSPSAAGPSPSTEAPLPFPTPAVYNLTPGAASATTMTVHDSGRNAHTLSCGITSDAVTRARVSSMKFESIGDNMMKVTITTTDADVVIAKIFYHSSTGEYNSSYDPTADLERQDDNITYIGYLNEGTVWHYSSMEDGATMNFGVLMPQ